MRILLVGGGGFVGGNLSRRLASRGHEIFLSDLPAVAKNHAGMLPIDLGDAATVNAALSTAQPDCIFHLAAQSMVSRSWEDPTSTFDTNITGTIRLYSSIRKLVPSARLIFIGSGEEYGVADSTVSPFTEDTICCPRNPYAISKLSAGMALESLARRDGIDLLHLRPFNHYGPGQREGFVVADFCAQIARIEAGLQPPEMKIGCLEARRDLLFIDDVLAAYALLAECKSHKEMVYNICSGVSRPIQAVLDTLLKNASCDITVRIDATKYRKPETPVLCASHERLTREFGWLPQNDFAEGLRQTLDDWREKVRQ